MTKTLFGLSALVVENLSPSTRHSPSASAACSRADHRRDDGSGESEVGCMWTGAHKKLREQRQHWQNCLKYCWLFREAGGRGLRQDSCTGHLPRGTISCSRLGELRISIRRLHGTNSRQVTAARVSRGVGLRPRDTDKNRQKYSGALSMALTLSIFLTAVVGLLSALFHYEAISRLDTFARSRRWSNHAVLVWVLGALLLIHAAEIGLFAGVYGIAGSIGIGGLRSENVLTSAEYFIFAAETYTSLGSTDVMPEGEIRLMSSLSSLVGILLLTWSASFLFSLVERWRAPPSNQ